MSIFRTLLACSLLTGSGTIAADESRPNVLFIAIDDLNDWVGPLGGHPLAQTPNLDRLAARGVTFTNAHCQAPLCNPSRTSVLTGLRPSTTGVYALNVWFRNQARLRDVVTLPQHFMQSGYRVTTTGKVFHDAYPPPAGRADGVEFTTWGPHGGFNPRPPEKFVHTPDNNPLVDWGIWPQRDQDCFDYDLASFAAAELQSNAAAGPWMLCMGLRHPHVPCYAPPAYFALYPDDDRVLPAILQNDRSDVPEFAWYLNWKLPEPRRAWLEQANQWTAFCRAYLASISFVDAQVGRVLDALQDSGQAEQTVVVLWSDHGFHLGEKSLSGKNTLWNESTRVPLIFAGPGIASGLRCEQPAELLDLYPTLIELCNLPSRSNLEGQSLMPQLRDPRTQRQRPALTTHGPGNHSLRSQRWRYTRYADGSEELYDQTADPHEWTNQAANPAFAANKTELAVWMPEQDAPPLPGGVVRLVELRDGTVYWEGQPVTAQAKSE